MRIQKQDLKHGFVQVLVEHPEDLWYLSHIIDTGDSVKGQTERKIKIGGEDARNQKVVRKPMTLTLTLEKIDYTTNSLRLLGTITDGPEDVARGEHHSFNVQPGESLGITKKSWANWQLDKLKEASAGPKESVLVVLFDRENALFALLSTHGHQVLSKFKGEVQKKDVEEQTKSTFWKQLSQQLTDYDKRYSTKSIIAASPAFWKDYVKKEIAENIAKKTIYATVSDTDEAALTELVKRPELKSALAADRSAQEAQHTADLLAAIAKDKAAYGIDEVETKVNEGALKSILVSENYLAQTREENTYERLDTLLKTAESSKAQIHIITTEDSLKQIDGLGGIAGILRWS